MPDCFAANQDLNYFCGSAAYLHASQPGAGSVTAPTAKPSVEQTNVGNQIDLKPSPVWQRATAGTGELISKKLRRPFVDTIVVWLDDSPPPLVAARQSRSQSSFFTRSPEPLRIAVDFGAPRMRTNCAASVNSFGMRRIRAFALLSGGRIGKAYCRPGLNQPVISATLYSSQSLNCRLECSVGISLGVGNHAREVFDGVRMHRS